MTKPILSLAVWLLASLGVAAFAIPMKNKSVIKTHCVLQPPANGYYEPQADEVTAVGRYVKLRCNRGYRLSGPELLQCGINGNLSPHSSCEDIDECQLISSEADDYPSYSLVSSQADDSQENRIDTPPPGYPCATRCVNTPGSFVCQCDSNIQCDSAFHDCDEIRAPEFGKIVEKSAAHVVFKCHEGHRLVGSERRFCINGLWDGREPTCEVLRCKAPQQSIPNGWSDVANKTYVFGDEVIYGCDDGFRVAGGTRRRMCVVRSLSDMTTHWSGETPWCTEIRCPQLSIENGQTLLSGSNRIGSQAEFRCSAGYDLRGSRTRLCQTNGKWSGTITTCNHPDNYCPAPEIPPMGYLTGHEPGTVIQEGSVIQYKCNIGYDFVGHSQRTCNSSGYWSSKAPHCLSRWEYDDARLVGQLLSHSAHQVGNEYRAPEVNIPGRSWSILLAQPQYDVEDHGLDVFFLFDVSRSVRNGNNNQEPMYLKAIRFAKAYVEKAGVSPLQSSGVRYAVVAYASEVTVNLHLHVARDENMVFAALDDIQRVVEDEDNTLGDGTATAKALQTVQTSVIAMALKNNRKGTEKILFLFTDGQSNMAGPPAQKAELLKSDLDVKITCIGVGGEVDRSELIGIASEPKDDHVFLLDSQTLSELVATLTATPADYNICGESKGPKNLNSTVAEDVWPWQAGLYTYEKGTDALPSFFCGGSLIRPDWILTAAHCFDPENDRPNKQNTEKLLVVMGTNERIQRGSNIDHAREQQREVKRLIIHRRYDHTILPKYDFDIALLKLKKPFNLGPFVRKVCLPPATNDTTTLLAEGKDRIPIATGWGKLNQNDKNKYSDVLKQLPLPIRSRDECRIREWEINGNLTRRMFCAGYPDGRLDACEGDSGGPLVRRWHPQIGTNNAEQTTTSEWREMWYQVGIVSWGIGCSRDGNYGYYTHVPNLMPWIEGKLGENVQVEDVP